MFGYNHQPRRLNKFGMPCSGYTFINLGFISSQKTNWNYDLYLFLPEWLPLKLRKIIFNPLHFRKYNTLYGLAKIWNIFGFIIQNRIATKASGIPRIARW